MSGYNSKTRIIDLSNQNLTEIPSEVFRCANLRKLYIYNNKIRSIPSEIKNLKHLITLDISNNELGRIYAPIGSLKKLRILMLNKNNIKILPSQFAELRNLIKLGLSDNLFKKIPKVITELPNLKELQFYGNNYIPLFEELESFKADLKIKWGNVYSSKMNYDEPLLNDKNQQSIEIRKISGDIKSTKKGITEINKDEENNKIVIFVSYAQADNKGDFKWLDDYVRPQLMQLETLSNRKVEIWDDSKIKGGKNIPEEIEKNLNKADCSVLLFSHNYINSNFVRTKEIPPIINAAVNKGMLLKGLLLSPCPYQKLPFFKDIKLDNNDLNKPFLKLVKENPNEILEILSKMVNDIFEELDIKTDINIYKT